MHVPPYFLYLTRINQKGAESLFPRRGCKKPKHLMHKLLLSTTSVKYQQIATQNNARQSAIFPPYGSHQVHDNQNKSHKSKVLKTTFQSKSQVWHKQ